MCMNRYLICNDRVGYNLNQRVVQTLPVSHFVFIPACTQISEIAQCLSCTCLCSKRIIWSQGKKLIQFSYFISHWRKSPHSYTFIPIRFPRIEGHLVMFQSTTLQGQTGSSQVLHKFVLFCASYPDCYSILCEATINCPGETREILTKHYCNKMVLTQEHSESTDLRQLEAANYPHIARIPDLESLYGDPDYTNKIIISCSL